MNHTLKAVGLRLKSMFSTESRQNRFRRYAFANKWNNKETVSGPGSTVEYTENLRKELPRLFDMYEIKSMLDAPCGDYNWMRLVERPNVQYVGGEIVPELVEANNARYANDNTRFIHCDILNGELPSVDLWMCRDVLFHFPFSDIAQTLNNLYQSDIAYLLTSDHPRQKENFDIPVGSFRPLNVLREPMCFPEAILWIDDWIEGFPVRRMGLWEVETLRQVRNPVQ